MRSMLLVAAVALLVLPVAAHAKVRPWVGANGGAATYAMTSINNDLGAVNILLDPWRMDDVKHGFGFGGMAGVDVTPAGLTLGAGYDRLTGRSRTSFPGGSLEYSVPASELRAFARLTVVGSGRAAGFLELGVGRIQSLGELVVESPGQPKQSYGLDGHAAAYDAAAGARVTFGPRLAGTLSLGYRGAKIGDLRHDGGRMQAADGTFLALDYSGTVLRAGVEFALAR